MADPRWPVGTPVEVRTRFDRAWAGGFEVAAVRDEGPTYRVRGGSQTERSSLRCSSRLRCASNSAERRGRKSPLLLVRGESHVGDARRL